ncbi:hypothetical protein Fcan01_26066 [Folsomia candida]|uniref:Uncharacterized protein n=1 Tax=Folsomia candida TaxID=158441 RepID=A0A226D2S8_FOLCA|nr:hypothetical protein Fcan01_26066 [Folsomia candida]
MLYHPIRIQMLVLEDVEKMMYLKLLVQILLGGIIIVHTFGLYFLVQFWTTLPIPVSAFLIVLALANMFLILVVFRFVARPYCKSEEFLRTASQQRNKWLRRVMWSCSPIKLTLGDGKYLIG